MRGQQIDSNKLRDVQTKQSFRRELKNRLQIFGEEQEMNINSFNQIFKEAGEKVLGFRKKKKEEWIQEQTWKKIDRKTERNQTENELHPVRMDS